MDGSCPPEESVWQPRFPQLVFFIECRKSFCCNKSVFRECCGNRVFRCPHTDSEGGRYIGSATANRKQTGRTERHVFRSSCPEPVRCIKELAPGSDFTQDKEIQVMRKYFVIAAMVVGGLFAGVQGAGAQSALLNLPRESQRASVSQRIGITDITINYHRPQVKGRKVFGPGSAQAYGQVWRAGANENTTINFTNDVTVEGKPLAKGVYGLHMIPGESDWTVIFSKNSTSWGSFTYDAAEDALRVTVKSHPAEMEEALVYDFDNVHHNEATIVMRWEKVTVPIHVDSFFQAEDGIRDYKVTGVQTCALPIYPDACATPRGKPAYRGRCERARD